MESYPTRELRSPALEPEVPGAVPTERENQWLLIAHQISNSPEFEAEAPPVDLAPEAPVEPAAGVVAFFEVEITEPPEALAPSPAGVPVGAESGVLEEKPSGRAVPTALAVSKEAAIPLEIVALVTQFEELGVLNGASGVTVSPTVYGVG